MSVLSELPQPGMQLPFSYESRGGKFTAWTCLVKDRTDQTASRPVGSLLLLVTAPPSMLRRTMTVVPGSHKSPRLFTAKQKLKWIGGGKLANHKPLHLDDTTG